MFETVFVLHHELKKLYHVLKMMVKSLAASKTLFDVVSKGTKISRRSLKFDVACASAGFTTVRINHIAFINSNNSLADELTKLMKKIGYYV